VESFEDEIKVLIRIIGIENSFRYNSQMIPQRTTEKPQRATEKPQRLLENPHFLPLLKKSVRWKNY